MTPIPILSWVFPFIGHVGICDSLGRVHDFSGHRTITIDRMAFGRPAIFAHLPGCHSSWDDGIAAADQIFRGKSHKWLSSNCHHHVAACLQEIKYCDSEWPEEREWSTFDVWFMLWRNAQLAPKRTSFLGYFVPVICTYLVIILVVQWAF